MAAGLEATFDFVERTKFQCKTRPTLLPFLATMSNVASTLLLMWTGLYEYLLITPSPPDSVGEIEIIMFSGCRPPRSFVRSFEQILLPR